MPTNHGIRVVVEVAGVEAEEYKVKTTMREDGVRATRCAIESISGAQLGVHVSRVGSGYGKKVVAELIVDGECTLITNSYITADPTTMDFAVQPTEDGAKRVPLLFAPMQPVAEESAVGDPGQRLVDNGALDRVGQIHVEIWTARSAPEARRHSRDQDADFDSLNTQRQAILTEKQKKSALVTHTVGYGPPIEDFVAGQPKVRRVKLIHVFVFDYLSRGTPVMLIAAHMLEVHGYIPAAPGATSASTSSAADPERDDASRELIDVKSEANPHANKRHHPNKESIRTPSVVYLDDSDDEEEESRAPRKLPVKSEPSSSSSTTKSTVITLLNSDDEE
ncbi:hypothetical protein H9P43_000855 [Blastocladiella emersonii ATCC 22665]|nr:hypothetical protein H9P43_000855 [Blastocladiella emersonii ATCC 22665]